MPVPGILMGAEDMLMIKTGFETMDIVLISALISVLIVLKF